MPHKIKFQKKDKKNSSKLEFPVKIIRKISQLKSSKNESQNIK